MNSVDCEFLVIGGGVIGLSIARKISSTSPKTILIEKNSFLGEESSSRNSGVIHAGFYYPLDSLKSKLCNLGNKLLYKYCKDRNIFCKNTKKLLVTKNSEDLELFDRYRRNAESVGGDELRILEKSEIKQIEPEIETNYALLSPESGIFDVHSYMNSLEKEILDNGGLVSINTELKSVEIKNNQFFCAVNTKGEDFLLKAKKIIFCVGLQTEHIGQLFLDETVKGLKKHRYTKGHYFKLSGPSPFKHLIYPIPSKFGLGLHSGLDIDGSTRFGPDTFFVEDVNYKFERNLHEKFILSIAEYWPNIKNRNISEDYVGIRPKIQTENQLFADFEILSEELHGIENLLILQGIESPGLTCSLALSELIFNSFINK